MSSHKSVNVYAAILDTVKRIPKGKVATYGEVAQLSGLPGYSRHVGYALHSLKADSRLPWHRVINSKGEISFPENSRYYREQKKLLLKEGVIFSGKRLNFKKYGLISPSSDQ